MATDVLSMPGVSRSILFLRLKLKTRLVVGEVGVDDGGDTPPTLLLSLSTVFSTALESRLTLLWTTFWQRESSTLSAGYWAPSRGSCGS